MGTYQTPITIKKALERIHARGYVLPAIQREFVWGTDQIERLFDSLLRGYPIGPFLFWNVQPDHSRDFVFYEFMSSFHERTNRHNRRLELPSERALVAVLDGQQRLTALNIALTGTYARKLPHRRRNNPDAYPVWELFLDLCWQPGEDDEAEFRFEFVTPSRAQAESHGGRRWYRVRDVLALGDDEMAPIDYVEGLGLPDAERRRAFRVLSTLRRVLTVDPQIAYHEEDRQDLDRVLNIFIRVNSGGTPLSYADLLLSIATAQWEERDAREEIHALVDALNDTHQGFDFDRNLVLKAGLLMTDASSIAFKVTNFNQGNMLRLEAEWSRIEGALKLAVALVGDYGFSERTLRSNSALIPIADYLYQRGADDSYRTRGEHATERAAIKDWLFRSQLKAGVWGSGLDTLLLAIRESQRAAGAGYFPAAEIEAAMSRQGKGLRFGEEEIEALVETPYDRNKGRDFALLALMYPGTNVRSEFHVDHVFPRSRFKPTALADIGMAPDDVALARDRMNRLPNLQLLEGPINVSKQDQMPLAWATGQHADASQLGLYLAGHDLDGLPAALEEFGAFYETRRERMTAKLRTLLGVPARQPAGVDAVISPTVR